MFRIVIQLKKRIDLIDFRKIYKGFNKMNFLLLYKNELYGICKKYPILSTDLNKDYLVIDGIHYVIISYFGGKIDYDKLVVELIVKMFKVQKKPESSLNKELKYLAMKKDHKYYEDKYLQNLMIVKALKGNLGEIFNVKNFLKTRIKNNPLIKVEEELECLAGVNQYVYLKTLRLVSPVEFNNKILQLINVLEDPTKLLEYLNYISSYGASLLLILNNDQIFINNNELDLDLSIINFKNLLTSNETKIRRIMMYKMIHSKKQMIKGKLLFANSRKVLVSDDLFYVPKKIVYLENNKRKEKDGDFIIKMNEDLSITESYECLSIDRLA